MRFSLRRSWTLTPVGLTCDHTADVELKSTRASKPALRNSRVIGVTPGDLGRKRPAFAAMATRGVTSELTARCTEPHETSRYTLQKIPFVGKNGVKFQEREHLQLAGRDRFLR